MLLFLDEPWEPPRQAAYQIRREGYGRAKLCVNVRDRECFGRQKLCEGAKSIINSNERRCTFQKACFKVRTKRNQVLRQKTMRLDLSHAFESTTARGVVRPRCAAKPRQISSRVTPSFRPHVPSRRSQEHHISELSY